METQHNVTERTTEDVSRVKGFFHRLFVKKDIDGMLRDAEGRQFKRELTVYHLLFLGIGNVIGTGIYVLSGMVAAQNAGPAVVICFMIASVVASLSALCYSELAAMIPVAGSAYSYTYATMGEFVAWLVGWALVLEYLIGVAAVAVGWSGYLVQFFHDAFRLDMSPKWTQAFVEWDNASSAFRLTGNYLNIPAIAILTALSILLVVGTRESATVTAVACVVKLLIIMVFIVGAGVDVDVAYLTPFLPPAQPDYYGHYGVGGILKGASIVFFCYAGFDSISTASQEARNPGRDMPIGILGSLGVCTLIYIAVCIVLVGICPYPLLNVAQPITTAIAYIGKRWLGVLVGASAVVGMITAMVMGMMGQSRIFFCMAKDGLLPPMFMRVHSRFQTPHLAQLVVWILTSLVAGTLPVDVLGELSGVGTLFAFFLVCLSVMLLRIRRPDIHRPFKVPFGPYVIPLLGSLSSIGLVFASSPSTLLRLLVWILIGVSIYFCYGFRNSKSQAPQPAVHLEQCKPI
ncbi:hypothetical protein DSO57_1026286 [Entomophthora muscae]|uniref:Uncharacterized protein n=1 Tax=Entomophthora muscae TaxID=34485 RepID=A0ACC2SEU2_9FUNG|nr:hypothetical protein DSO57_1026286 [Entomophthora muscae]